MNRHQIDDETRYQAGRLARTWILGGTVYLALTTTEGITTMKTRLYSIVKDGREVMSGLPDRDAALAWFHQHTPFSMHHATEHEGYAIVPKDYDS